MPGTNPCQTPASYSSRAQRVSVPSASNRQTSTPSATSEATATFVPPSPGVAPSGNGRPGRAGWEGTHPTLLATGPCPPALGPAVHATAPASSVPASSSSSVGNWSTKPVYEKVMFCAVRVWSSSTWKPPAASTHPHIAAARNRSGRAAPASNGTTTAGTAAPQHTGSSQEDSLSAAAAKFYAPSTSARLPSSAPAAISS